MAADSAHLSDQDIEQARALYRETVAELLATARQLDDGHSEAVRLLAADVFASWQRGGKLMICGNGGSAADSQHIAAELVGRFKLDRPGYAALALTTNSSTLTAVANDYGYEQVFSRQVEGLGGPDDVLLVISTSGNSGNCIKAVEVARRIGMRVHGFLGGDGGKLLGMLDGALVPPSANTPRIQEIHITMGHLLCQILEEWAARAKADRGD
ncbi:phosphoheptose isomerase [bacterium DOLJORAL78_65_58]|nr:MAG: phosphoheptose isomerase [bacterium DOLZORAL124_64_63]PIE76404.1 MAG: phosphoheptose isomerase [bacterium DOLJORAL78_65_58]